MDNVLFRRGDQTFIDENVPLNDGQIIFNETDEAIYLDVTINNNVVRKRYGGGNLSRSDIDMAFSTTSENPIANKVVTNAIGSLSSLQTDVKTNLVSAINEVNTKVSKTEDLISNSGDAYSASKAYKVGDYVIHDDKLYRCITACSAGSWATNQSCFTQDTLVNVGNGLSNLFKTITKTFASKTYQSGEQSNDTLPTISGYTPVFALITQATLGAGRFTATVSAKNNEIFVRNVDNNATTTDLTAMVYYIINSVVKEN